MEPRRNALSRLAECGCRPIAPSGVDTGEIGALARLSFTLDEGPSRGLRHLRYLLPVSAMSCSVSGPNDDDLADLESFPELRILYLESGRYTDLGLRHVGRMEHLEILSARDFLITDAGLLELARLGRLRVLDLSTTSVEGKVLTRLSCKDTLEELNLWGVFSFTDEGLLQLRHFRKLKRADLIVNGDYLDGHGFAVLSKLPNLQQVGLPEYFREHWEPHVSHIPEVYTE